MIHPSMVHPTSHGAIELSIEQTANVCRIDATLPAGMTGELVMSGAIVALQPGHRQCTIRK